jgi:hypothetical protein
MPEPIRLPTHEVKLFRAFLRAEVGALEARVAARGRVAAFLTAPFSAVASAWRCYRYGASLGLPIPTIKRAGIAEFEEMEAGR